MLRHNVSPLKGKNRLNRFSVLPQEINRMPVVMKAINRINVLRPACNAMFGKDHPLWQRLATGVVVALSGVAISKVLGHSESHVIAYAGDAIGYGLHGLGITPFIEFLAKASEDI